MSELPPLPKGFVLDGEQSAALPQLPFGFKLDSASEPTSPVADFFKSIPRGVIGGLASTSSIPEPGSPIPIANELLTPAPEMVRAAESGLTGPLHQPEGRLGQLGASVGQGLGNPLSWVGPGSLPFKAAGSVLGSLGSEGGRQAAEGTPFEIPAQIAGGLAGGTAAVKAMGAKPLAAAVPNSQELRAVKDAGYQAARDADLVLDPHGPASMAAQWEHELTNGPKYAFTGGTNGTAPKTLAALAEAQTVPTASAGERATVTGANLDTLRIKLNNIASETHEFKPTPDAKAAMVAKQRLAEYTENIPQDHILAGDAKAYGSQTKTANANNAAFRRVSGFEQKLTNSTDATEGSIAVKIDNKIKSNLRNGYLTNDKKQRGLTQDEVAAIRQTNRGSFPERALRQVGRFAPEGPMNLALHVGTGLGAAAATGGVSIPIQIAAALGASAAKHAAQRMTKNNAANVLEMLAMRSPEYKKRAALTNLFNELMQDKLSNPAAVLRSGILGARF